MSNEANARIIINRLLREADCDIEDKVQVSTEEAAVDVACWPMATVASSYSRK